jgi:regulatory protein
MTGGPPRRGQRRRRGPRKATPQYLRNAALHYLDRYAASAAHLRRLLIAKVERSARAHGTERTAGAEAVERLIADLVRAGLLDDRRYAGERARALFRRGASARAIRADLRAKGVEAELIDRALDGLLPQAVEPELAAALAFARRRRLGPYRTGPERADHRARDLAALGRQGYGYGLARRVIEADDLADLEAEAGLA